VSNGGSSKIEDLESVWEEVAFPILKYYYRVSGFELKFELSDFRL
jgi:hypothetical protein